MSQWFAGTEALFQTPFPMFFPDRDELVAAIADKWGTRLRNILPNRNVYWNNLFVEFGGTGLGIRGLASGLLSAANILCDLGQVNQTLWASVVISTDER